MAHGTAQATFGLGDGSVIGTGGNVADADNRLDSILAAETTLDEASTTTIEDEHDLFEDEDAGLDASTVEGALVYLGQLAREYEERITALEDEIEALLPRTTFHARILAGQDETGDATIDLVGLAARDDLVLFAVIATTASVATITARALSDFTLTKDVLTVGANAANNSGNSYLVLWQSYD